MKKVYVLRHANWNLEKGELTAEAAEKTKLVADKLPAFDFIVSSPTKRAIETAVLLSRKKFTTDKRAATMEVTEEQSKKIAELRIDNPYGAVGAIFEIPELIEPLQNIGQELVGLIRESLSKCPDGKNVLIISHDGTMVAAEKILENKDFLSAGKTFGEIEGFKIDEKFNIEQFNTVTN